MNGEMRLYPWAMLREVWIWVVVVWLVACREINEIFLVYYLV